MEVTIAVNIKTEVFDPEYEFMTKPPKLAWGDDIAFRFENLLQTPEFSSKFDNFVAMAFDSDQAGIDTATDILSNILIEGAVRSDISAESQIGLVKPTIGLCSKVISSGYTIFL